MMHEIFYVLVSFDENTQFSKKFNTEKEAKKFEKLLKDLNIFDSRKIICDKQVYFSEHFEIPDNYN